MKIIKFIAVFKIVGTAAILLLFGLLWQQNFKQLFLTHFCTDSLDSSSKCVLLIIAEVPTPLSKQYYQIMIFQGVPVSFALSVNSSARSVDFRSAKIISNNQKQLSSRHRSRICQGYTLHYAPYAFPYQIRTLSFYFWFLSFINSYPYEFIAHYVQNQVHYSTLRANRIPF